jgi:hypothetical protein
MVTDDPRALHVAVRRGYLVVDLVDGRQVRVPVSWFPRLAQATQTQREEWELLDEGRGIRWPAIDEDLSVAGLLHGRRGSSKRAV